MDPMVGQAKRRECYARETARGEKGRPLEPCTSSRFSQHAFGYDPYRISASLHPRTLFYPLASFLLDHQVAARNAFNSVCENKGDGGDDATLDQSEILTLCQRLGLGSISGDGVANDDERLDGDTTKNLGLIADGDVVEREQVTSARLDAMGS